MTPGDVRAYDHAIAATRTLLQTLIEGKRRLQDGELVDDVNGRAHVLAWRVKANLDDLPSDPKAAPASGPPRRPPPACDREEG